MWKQKDPIRRMAVYLKGVGLLDDEKDARLRAEVEAEVREAAAWAEAQPDPDPATVGRFVYAEEGSDGVGR